MKYLIATLLILISISIFGLRISKRIAFEQNVSGYLKRAADANTIQLANEELTKAIDYLEENNLTEGYTSVFYRTPDEDINFWYRNLKASRNELQNLNSESALERTNVLMKLRETLLDTGKKSKVTVPRGLAVYPDNKLWGLLMSIAISAGLIGFAVFAAEAERRSKEKEATKQ